MLFENCYRLTSNKDMGVLIKKNNLSVHDVKFLGTSKENYTDITICIGGKNLPIFKCTNLKPVCKKMNEFSIIVGNECGKGLVKINFSNYIQYINTFINNPYLNINIDADEDIITSSQACLLPVKDDGTINFLIKMYSHNSSSLNPSYLTIVSTTIGTSVYLAYDKTDMYFNDNGRNLMFKINKNICKLDDFVKDGFENNADMGNIYVFQIPIKQTSKKTLALLEQRAHHLIDDYNIPYNNSLEKGEIVNSYSGTKGLPLIRDKSRPILCTIHHYTIIKSQMVSENQIKDVYMCLNMAPVKIPTSKLKKPSEILTDDDLFSTKQESIKICPTEGTKSTNFEDDLLELFSSPDKLIKTNSTSFDSFVPAIQQPILKPPLMQHNHKTMHNPFDDILLPPKQIPIVKSNELETNILDGFHINKKYKDIPNFMTEIQDVYKL